MELLILLTFVIGYIAITLEHGIKIDKAASALVTGGLCWTIYILFQADKDAVSHEIIAHFGEIAAILFFLLGAMTIVELIDAHEGFNVIKEAIKIKSATQLLWVLSFITFFLSALLDNLTTTIVMVSLLRKIVSDEQKRLFFAGIIVIAANAGGAWSPLGDVTTTMLWIGKQITATNIMAQLILPSIVCLIVPLVITTLRLRGTTISIPPPSAPESAHPNSNFERNLVFTLGIGALLFVPIFKSITHLPPVIAMLLALGLLWIATELIHSKKNSEDKNFLTVVYALRKIDSPSILFFLGILISVAALQTTGQLQRAAEWLAETVGNESFIVLLIGILSAVVDNVPLVAATQGMYSLEQYPTDHYFWEFLAYATGTGGSILIIGSAAGVAAMGIEKINFFWYIKNISLLALLGYLAGAATYVIQYNLLH